MRNEEKRRKFIEASYEKAVLKLNDAKSEEDRFYALGKKALASLDFQKYEDAKKNADELNDLIPKYQGNWNYGNAIEVVNVVYGRLALINGWIADAKNYLLRAGESCGSPQMMSFGPNLSLAKQLLDIGEKEIVLECFELCRKFWKSEHSELDQWSDEIKSGVIPNFGGNLYY